jgi:hypothetical protein
MADGYVPAQARTVKADWRHLHRLPPDLRFEPVSAWGALGKPYPELYLSSKSSIGARRPVTSTSNMAAWPASA